MGGKKRNISRCSVLSQSPSNKNLQAVSRRSYQSINQSINHLFVSDQWSISKKKKRNR